jgi:hypothetical protein
VPLYEGNGGGTGGTSLRLYHGAGGRWSATHGAAASRGAVAQPKEGDDLKVGWARVGHVGRVMLAGLAHNRKKKGKRPMMAWAEVKAFRLKWELGSRFSLLNLNQVLS